MKSDTGAWSSAERARVDIASLAQPFLPVEELHAQPVPAEQLTNVFGQLLAHNEHMTVRLAQHHGAPVRLEVQEVKRSGDDYLRRILLRVPACAESAQQPATAKPVEFGIVHLSLNLVEEPVRREILAQSAPLGDILIRHNVFRRIEPRWYYRFGPASCVRREMGMSPQEPLYGRVGTIHCDGRPAIELLEVVRA